MPDFHLYGRKAHLVLEDEDGTTFEVLGALKMRPPSDMIMVDLARVSAALTERANADKPKYREVTFHA